MFITLFVSASQNKQEIIKLTFAVNQNEKD